MSIYRGQGYLTISLNTGRDIASATNPRIYFTKPNGDKGYWEATKSGQSIEKTFDNTDLPMSGTWLLQAYCEFSGFKSWGEIEYERITTSLE